jgi:hypothetical protein
MVANAPLKLPTGVRAALTMTTSSDMDILLYGFSWLVSRRRAGRGWRASLNCYPVNVVEACQRPRSEKLSRRMQNRAPGRLLSSPDALGLTVLHKTVAEAL